MSPRQAGFTLLEVLVALVVLGLLLAGLAQGTQFGLRVADRQAATIAATADLDATDRVLRGLIAQMDPGTLTAAPLLDATANGLAFTTNLDSVAPAAGIGDGRYRARGHAATTAWCCAGRRTATPSASARRRPPRKPRCCPAWPAPTSPIAAAGWRVRQPMGQPRPAQPGAHHPDAAARTGAGLAADRGGAGAHAAEWLRHPVLVQARNR